MMEASTRSARNRRVVAILGWIVLVGTAMLLMNGRIAGTIRTVSDEPIAFALAAFSAFIGVFAWLLFNPGRREASESRALFLAAGATLFPPPIIGFCLMPVDSPLRGWLAVGIFLLCVVAVLSHIPEDFFAIPRGKNSYLTAIPTFDSVDDNIMNPNAAWFTFEDLSRVLPDTDRPSLAPRAYLHQSDPRPAAQAAHSKEFIATEVDDILGSDFDLGLLEEDLNEYRTPASHRRRSERPLERRRSRSDSETSRRKTFFTRNEGQNEAIEEDQVFESFRSLSSESRRPAVEKYISASGKQTATRNHKKRFKSAAVGAASGIAVGGIAATEASSIRSQLRSARRVTSAQSLNFQQQHAESKSPSRKSSSDETTRVTKKHPIGHDSQRPQDNEVAYGSLDVHRGKQPRRPKKSHEQSDSSGTSRQQERRVVEQRERVRREEKTVTDSSVRSEKVVEESVQTKKSRSAIDIATAGILGVGAAAAAKLSSGIRSSETVAESVADLQPDQMDQAASQGLFGSVKDLFSKPKTLVDDEITGADEFESAVESLQPQQESHQDISIERTVDASGVELAEGVAIVRFEPGQKKANVHIPFTPSMNGSPVVEVECVGDEQLRLKVPMAEPFGMRIEARRKKTNDYLEAEIGFAAMAEDD